MPKKISLIGKTFGRLIVIKEAPRRMVGKSLRFYYLCQCQCGKEKEILGGALSSGASQSCGCVATEKLRLRATRHGHTVGGMSRTYSIWVKIKTRCYDEKHNQYQDYGGRGITVCERWLHSFDNFLEDMGPCPPNLSIDRINNNGNYELGNCRWATMGEQHRNKRSNRIVEVGGFAGCFTDAAAHFGISPYTAFARLRYGWTTEEIFLTPVR